MVKLKLLVDRAAAAFVATLSKRDGAVIGVASGDGQIDVVRHARFHADLSKPAIEVGLLLVEQLAAVSVWATDDLGFQVAHLAKCPAASDIEHGVLRGEETGARAENTTPLLAERQSAEAAVVRIVGTEELRAADFELSIVQVHTSECAENEASADLLVETELDLAEQTVSAKAVDLNAGAAHLLALVVEALFAVFENRVAELVATERAEIDAGPGLVLNVARRGRIALAAKVSSKRGIRKKNRRQSDGASGQKLSHLIKSL